MLRIIVIFSTQYSFPEYNFIIFALLIFSVLATGYGGNGGNGIALTFGSIAAVGGIINKNITPMFSLNLEEIYSSTEILVVDILLNS